MPQFNGQTDLWPQINNVTLNCLLHSTAVIIRFRCLLTRSFHVMGLQYTVELPVVMSSWKQRFPVFLFFYILNWYLQNLLCVYFLRNTRGTIFFFQIPRNCQCDFESKLSQWLQILCIRIGFLIPIRCIISYKSTTSSS